ncbi:MAG: hypothetical protein KA227_12040 [Thermoanaerobaculia bacterium]|nr:hypothetical protein [Thermoanaerobaculia bacterium]
MGSSNRTRVAYVAESNWGVTPATPTLTTVRRTGGSLKSPTETVTSNEIRSDRNRATVQRVGVSANGSMEFELSYGSHDDLLAAAFASAWTPAINFSDSVQITALTGTIAATGAFTNASVGQWLKLSGFTTPGNNGYFRVATKTSANEITVEDPDDVLEDETKSAAITSGGCLRNGTTESSFTIEQSHLDLGFYLQFLGMRVGGVNLSIPASGLITGSFDFQGKEATASAATIANTLTVAGTNPVFNGTSHFAALTVGGAALADNLTEISVALTNNLRQRRALGSLAPVGVIYGTADVTGSFRLYPTGKTLIDKYLDFEESSLALRLVGGDGKKSYILTIPKLVFTGDLPETGALDGDVTLDLNWTAYFDSGLDCTIQLDRFAA